MRRREEGRTPTYTSFGIRSSFAAKSFVYFRRTLKPSNLSSKVERRRHVVWLERPDLGIWCAEGDAFMAAASLLGVDCLNGLLSWFWLFGSEPC